MILPALLISEVYPNPQTGAEWVEIYLSQEASASAQQFADYSLHDNRQLLYRFTGQEAWSDQLLIVEVTGLNNDGDSVILQDDQEQIIDQMNYNTSQKGLSWSRISWQQAEFALTEASPGLLQLAEPSQAPPTPSVPTISPSIINPEPSTSPSTVPSSQLANKDQQPASPDFDPMVQLANYQASRLKLTTDAQTTTDSKQARLMILGQSTAKQEVQDVIMGSSLLLLAALLLSYEQN